MACYLGIHLSLLLPFSNISSWTQLSYPHPLIEEHKMYFYGNPATGHRPVRLPFTFHHFSIRTKPHSQSSIWHPTNRFPSNNSTCVSCLSVNYNEMDGKNVRSKFGSDNCVLMGYHTANSVQFLTDVSKQYIASIFTGQEPWISEVIMYITAIVIINMTVTVWSWKKITCSKKEKAPFCILILSHVVIIGSNESFKTLYVDLQVHHPRCVYVY
jgi:hypothetical protein